MNRETIDNTEVGAHNWIDRLMPDDPCDPRHTVQWHAEQVEADFDVDYLPSGYMLDRFGNGQSTFVVPRYGSGAYKGEPKDNYILRSDTGAVVGNMSGKYPHREGYKHVFDTLEQLFPEHCENITVFGDGERVVVEQCLDVPYDLGDDGDMIQPFVYTRMSLNGVWKTEIIPVARRISCENMLTHAGSVVAVRATKNHDKLLTMRSAIIEKSIAQGVALRNMAMVFKHQTFTDMAFEKMVKDIVPAPSEDAHTRTLNLHTDKTMAIRSAWKRELQSEDANMWTAYNAFQGAEQHKINAGFKTTAKSKERSLTRALDGKTPIADEAEKYLRELIHARSSSDLPY